MASRVQFFRNAWRNATICLACAAIGVLATVLAGKVVVPEIFVLLTAGAFVDLLCYRQFRLALRQETRAAMCRQRDTLPSPHYLPAPQRKAS